MFTEALGAAPSMPSVSSSYNKACCLLTTSCEVDDHTGFVANARVRVGRLDPLCFEGAASTVQICCFDPGVDYRSWPLSNLGPRLRSELDGEPHERCAAELLERFKQPMGFIFVEIEDTASLQVPGVGGDRGDLIFCAGRLRGFCLTTKYGFIELHGRPGEVLLRIKLLRLPAGKKKRVALEKEWRGAWVILAVSERELDKLHDGKGQAPQCCALHLCGLQDDEALLHKVLQTPSAIGCAVDSNSLMHAAAFFQEAAFQGAAYGQQVECRHMGFGGGGDVLSTTIREVGGEQASAFQEASCRGSARGPASEVWAPSGPFELGAWQTLANDVTSWAHQGYQLDFPSTPCGTASDACMDGRSHAIADGDAGEDSVAPLPVQTLPPHTLPWTKLRAGPPTAGPPPTKLRASGRCSPAGEPNESIDSAGLLAALLRGTEWQRPETDDVWSF